MTVARNCDWRYSTRSMSQSDYRRVPERIPAELIEADIEIAFSLVDMAEECLRERDVISAGRVLRDADDVLLDIRRRVAALCSEKRWPFDPLLGEVNRAIALAKSHTV